MDLLKSFKTEINPTPEQITKINKTIGTCRYLYNFYLSYNLKRYEQGEKFMSGKSFSVWLNNEYLPTHPEYSWIKEVSSKAAKHAVECGCTAFTRFFKHQSGFPKFKKKDISDVKMYFVKNSHSWLGETKGKGISANNERWLADSKRSRFEESGSILCIRFDGYSGFAGQIEGRSDRRNRN